MYSVPVTLTTSHRLPVLGAQHLEFRCNGCGACCRALRVAVTHRDLRRLASGLRRRAVELVDWLAPDAVDMTGEPDSFVELSAGRRLMVLAQRGGACMLLDAAQRCSAYAHRPRDCRLFPFDLSRDAAGSVTALSRLELEGCGDERGPSASLDELADLDGERWAELGEYRAHVARWNRLARHRRRFRQRVGDGEAFLAWLGLDAGSLGDGAAAPPR
jgi:Fe-S-cluster containining protein